MKKRLFNTLFVALAFGLWSLPTSAKADIVANQTDDFQDGTEMDWSGGAMPTNIITGGPAGAGDKYLQLTASGGFGGGSKLATYNDIQWIGDYASQGVTQIEMDLRNPNSVALAMRIMLLFGPGGDFTTTTAIPVPADGLWHHVVFGLSNADMTAVDGGTSLAQTLTDVGRLLIRHQTGPPAGIGSGTAFAGQLGIDNIHANPEPGTLLLLAAGAAGFFFRKRR